MDTDLRQCRMLYSIGEGVQEALELVYAHPQDHFTLVLMSWLADALQERSSSEHPEMAFRVIYTNDYPRPPLAIGVLSDEFEERFVLIPSEDDPNEMVVDMIGDDYSKFELEACRFVARKLEDASVSDLVRYANEQAAVKPWRVRLNEILGSGDSSPEA